MPAPRELDPTASALALFGYELRRHRTAAGLTLEQLAQKICFSQALVGMVENARRSPSLDFAERCDRVLDLDGALMRLWPFVNRASTPTWFRPWLEVEGEASMLHTWEPLVVPGLLQTEEYARAILRGEPRITPEGVEEQVAARMERQRIFERAEPPMLWAVVDEGVLQRPIGTDETMAGQLKHLLEAGTLPYVTIQVVPLSARSTTGLEGGFVIAQARGLPDTVYLECAGHSQVSDRGQEVHGVMTRYEVIRAEALPRRASLDLIRETMERWIE
ncbi:helix-turn-helix transcriptional regulator [Sphaerisporangium sp. TRM90804]|uniref:helix-turn-helix domain-containing protein n=1 Tax=Sphaerisporangium sp. TRM90804 TaxID=3031113 RepID=UPI002448EB70|nr:helix-turn-helix transcriptional regulator [Sphaerisporangium sp. TRM90804]MDH2430681.1 helix-turn-helix transcriptional regulator [Sphaerisporangium sp. TRM90804]